MRKLRNAAETLLACAAIVVLCLMFVVVVAVMAPVFLVCAAGQAAKELVGELGKQRRRNGK